MDISQSNWNELDASNSTAAPDGAPEGMAPAGINDVLRAHQGAVKRFWNRINAVKTTGGTSSAFTLAFDVAPTAYANGEIISFVVNATNAAAATLNVNALGSVPLRLFGGNLLAGALIADQIVQARYNSSAGAFDILTSPGWVRIGSASPSGASAVDFTSIPAGVNNLSCEFSLTPTTNAQDMCLRTYGADGNIDTGASDYTSIIGAINSSAVYTSAVGTDTRAFFTSGGTSNSATLGCDFSFKARNIQAATFTKFDFNGTAPNSTPTLLTWFGSFWRTEADRITGLRLLANSGNVTGRVTLFGSV